MKMLMALLATLLVSPIALMSCTSENEDQDKLNVLIKHGKNGSLGQNGENGLHGGNGGNGGNSDWGRGGDGGNGGDVDS